MICQRISVAGTFGESNNLKWNYNVLCWSVYSGVVFKNQSWKICVKRNSTMSIQLERFIEGLWQMKLRLEKFPLILEFHKWIVYHVMDYIRVFCVFCIKCKYSLFLCFPLSMSFELRFSTSKFSFPSFPFYQSELNPSHRSRT